MKERLKALCKALGKTEAQFQSENELPNGFVSQSRKSFSAHAFWRILRNYPNLNPEWLLYGEGEMFIQKKTIDIKFIDNSVIETAKEAQYMAQIKERDELLAEKQQHIDTLLRFLSKQNAN